MADIGAPIPAQLMSYIELVGAVVVGRSPTILAALVLVLQIAVQDLIEDVRAFLEANWTDMVRFASWRKDIGFYERELAEGHLNDLLVEAVCRMKNIQILIRRLGAPANTSRLFGVHGPLHEIIDVNGQLFTLRQPIIPWGEEALAAVAQIEQSQYQAAEEEELADVAGPSRVRWSSRRSRQPMGSLKRTTLKKTSRTQHLQFEVISSPIPPHVRSILTSTRAAAKRLSGLARRTLLSRVRFNPVAVVADISPLADKVPNVVRLPEDTVRQDDGDALEVVRADEAQGTHQAAAEEHQAAEEMEGERAEQVVMAEGPEEAEVGREEEVVMAEGPESAEVERQEEFVMIEGPETAEVGREEEVVMAEGPEAAEVAGAGEQMAEAEVVANGNEEEAVTRREEEYRTPPAEVVEPQEPAFEYDNNTYVCRLPGCPTPRKRFATLKGWKLHASLTRIHQHQGFCTGCGKFVVMPPQVEDHEKKIWLDSHRRERCEGASRAVLKARRLEKQRLEALWRDASHVRLPDEGETEVRRGQKRAYPTEEERRAGVCLAYIKHFKTINPARLDEVAADFQLTIL